ncbi:hypothetical protein HY572_05960 [Candidatus Micrarchaeota archaeon]|nr:hypothetical protein [Candidatus Micrarchaeota archaeon]
MAARLGLRKRFAEARFSNYKRVLAQNPQTPENFVYVLRGLGLPDSGHRYWKSRGVALKDQRASFYPEDFVREEIALLRDPRRTFSSSLVARLDARHASGVLGVSEPLDHVLSARLAGLVLDFSGVPENADILHVAWPTDSGTEHNAARTDAYLQRHSGKVKSPANMLRQRVKSTYNELFFGGHQAMGVNAVYCLEGQEEYGRQLQVHAGNILGRAVPLLVLRPTSEYASVQAWDADWPTRLKAIQRHDREFGLY